MLAESGGVGHVTTLMGLVTEGVDLGGGEEGDETRSWSGDSSTVMTKQDLQPPALRAASTLRTRNKNKSPPYKEKAVAWEQTRTEGNRVSPSSHVSN